MIVSETDTDAMDAALAASELGARAFDVGPSWNPKVEGDRERAIAEAYGLEVEQAPGGGSVRLVDAETVTPIAVTWTWDGRIPLGMLSLLIGEGGLGKSMLGIDLAAKLTRGTLPGHFYGKPVNVAIASAEDHRAAVIVPRLIAAGADLSRVKFLESFDGETASDIELSDNIDKLRSALTGQDIAFVLIDTVVAHIPAKHDSYKEQHVRAVLTPLAHMAESLSLSVLGVMHLNRRDGQDVLARMCGSGGFGNMARSVLLFARDPQEPKDSLTRHLSHAKCNVGLTQPSLRTEVESANAEHGGQLFPAGRLAPFSDSDRSSDDLLRNVSGEERTLIAEAVEFLQLELLPGGETSAGDLQKQAEAQGISARNLQRARSRAGVRTRKDGTAGGWKWSRPAA